MKPMLKAAFFSLVNELLAKGIKPELCTSTTTSYGTLKWSEGDKTFAEELYSVRNGSPLTAGTFRKRFNQWFADILASQPASAPTEQQPKMNSTEAIQHMAHTIAGAIEQSKKPGFVQEEAYADIVTNYQLVKAQCTDLATVVWLKARYCAGHSGDYTFEEINLPHLKSLEHVLETGYRPGTYSDLNMKLSTIFEMDWWGASEIAVTSHDIDNAYGTAIVNEVEGNYQIAFDWHMDATASLAERTGVPAMVYITDGRVTVPYEFSLVETDGTPLDTLTAIKEMDCVLDFSEDILDAVFNEYFPGRS